MKHKKIISLIVAFMLLIGCMSDSILSVSAKDIDTGSQKGNNTRETVSCNLSIDGGNGYVVIEDENGTFEKSYYCENSILYDEGKIQWMIQKWNFQSRKI